MTCRGICLVLVGLALPGAATAQVMFDTTRVTSLVAVMPGLHSGQTSTVARPVKTSSIRFR